jgi:transcriptional regulator with XRE-family HTH domain
VGIPDEGRAFGVWLAELREAAGLTQFDLSQAAGVSARTIQRWESGTHAPVDVVRVLTALGVQLDPPAPAAIQALNTQVAQLQKMLAAIEATMAAESLGPATGSDATPPQQPTPLDSRRELEATVALLAKEVRQGFERVAERLEALDERLPDAARAAPPKDQARRR